jgi:HEAT repeat protein
VRLKAAEVLARMGTDAQPAAAELTRLLDDPDERIRKAAARALGMIGPAAADAVPALMRSLTQPEPLPPSGELRPVPRE